MLPWEKDFSATRGTISAISFVSFLVFAISQPIIGRLIDKFGIRRIYIYSIVLLGVSTILTYFATSTWMLFLLFGIISSLGFGGASGVTASMAVTKWFHKKQGLALGLVEAGFGAGQMVIVSSSLLLIDHFGWKFTVLILGGFLLLIIFPILAFFLVSNPSDKGLKAFGENEREENLAFNRDNEPAVSVLQKPFYHYRAFWFLVIPYFICGFTTTGLMDTHLIPFAQSCGFTAAVTGTAVSLLALFNTGGTIVSGFLADRWNNRYMISGIYFLRGITIVFLLIFTLNVKGMVIFVEYPWLLFLFSISFGIVDFAVVAPTVKLLANYFKGQSLGIVTGFLFMSHQLGSAFGSYLPGFLYDRTFSYTSSFAIAAILLFGAAGLSVLLPKTIGSSYISEHKKESLSR